MADQLTMIAVYPDPKSGLLPVRAFGPGLPGAIRNHPGFDPEEAYAAARALMSPATLSFPKLYIPPPTDEDLIAAGLEPLSADEWEEAMEFAIGMQDEWGDGFWEQDTLLWVTESAGCEGSIDGALVPDDDRAA